jgi:hypothetical protein
VRKKISLALMGNKNAIGNKNTLGKKYGAEVRLKMSASAKTGWLKRKNLKPKNKK